MGGWASSVPHWYGGVNETPEEHLAESEGVKQYADELHLRKIELADEVFVVKHEDYLGESTRNEIEYARGFRKQLRWFSHDPVGKETLRRFRGWATSWMMRRQ